MTKSLQKPSSFLIGRAAEELICEYYRARGCQIIVRNFINRKGKQFGEIDFIATKDQQIFFVEVKARASTKFGAPIEMLTARKRARMMKSIAYFLLIHPRYQQLQPRIHLAAVSLNTFDKRPQSIRIVIDV